MRYLLSVLAIIIMVVIAIVIIATHGKTNTVKPIVVTGYNYAGTSVSQTTTGELVGDEQRQAYRITVTETSRTIYLLSGYQQVIYGSENFVNNPTAYGVFLGALQNAGFTFSRHTNEVNMFGVCPLGNTYQFELDSPTATVSNLWSTSCLTRDGTFAGTTGLIRTLFALQIPNFNAFTKGLTTVSGVSGLGF